MHYEHPYVQRLHCEPSSKLTDSLPSLNSPPCPPSCGHCLAYDNIAKSPCTQPASSDSKWCAVHEELQVGPLAALRFSVSAHVVSCTTGQASQVLQAPHARLRSFRRLATPADPRSDLDKRRPSQIAAVERSCSLEMEFGPASHRCTGGAPSAVLCGRRLGTRAVCRNAVRPKSFTLAPSRFLDGHRLTVTRSARGWKNSSVRSIGGPTRCVAGQPR